ncbi:hypothetical protein ACTXT7_008977 [Hymenolepis weldensis]
MSLFEEVFEVICPSYHLAYHRPTDASPFNPTHFSVARLRGKHHLCAFLRHRSTPHALSPFSPVRDGVCGKLIRS